MPYTPRQVSEMLSIPESSLRRLSREFSEFLSKQKGRNRRYTEQDISILQKVRESTAHGVTIEQIKTDLRIATPQEYQPPAADSLSLVPTIAGELSRLDDNYRAILQELEKLRNDRHADRERIEKLEQLAAWAARPWWKKIFQRPPEGL